MPSPRETWRYGSLFLRILVTLGLLLVATIVALAFALSASYERTTRRILEQSQLTLLSQVTYGFNSLDTQARAFATSLSVDNRVIPLLYGADLDIWSIVKSLDAISVRVQSTSFVDSVYIYNRPTGSFYTTMGQGIRTVSDFFDPQISSMVEAGRAVPKLGPIPRRIERAVLQSATPQEVNLYTYVYYASWPESGFPSAIFVNVPAQSLMANLDSLSQQQRGQGGSIVVVAGDGRIMADASPERFLRDASGDRIVSAVLRASGRSGSFMAPNSPGTGPSVVSWIASGPPGWRFIQVTPYQAILRPLIGQRSLILGISIAFAAAALLVAFFASRLLYLPIGSLVRHARRVLDSSEAIGRSENEMRFLSEAFSHTAGMVTLLRRFKADNLKTLRDDLLRGVLTGSLSAEEAMARLADFGLRLAPHGFFQVAACRLDRGMAGSGTRPASGDGVPAGNADGIEVRTFILERMARALTGVRFDCETVETERDLVAMVFSFSDPDAAFDGVEGHVRGLQRYLADGIGASLSAGLSDAGRGLASLSALYAQAVELASYRMVFGRGCLVTSARVAESSGTPYRFPVEGETRILEALTRCDLSQAEAALRETLDGLRRQDYETIRLSITRVASSLFDHLTMMESNGAVRFPFRFSHFMRSLDRCETLPEVQAEFLGLLSDVEEVLRSAAAHKPERNVQAVRDLIEERYRDCTLNVAALAEQMRMSPGYLARIFRERSGRSIAEYLTEVRLRKARELLGEGACAINEVSQRVGIANRRFLITKFKESFGVTPSEYRRTAGVSKTATLPRRPTARTGPA